ncbi:MAG: Tim44 domain-containing protein [Clostridiales bacterium]|nr:Tim44 domain-containing protein [Clostridiales bacterium]
MKKRLIPVLLILALVILFPLKSFADFGDYAGNNDYGGGYDGGGYDYGGNDYGGNYYGGSTYSSGDLELSDIIVGIVIIGGILLFSFIKTNGKNKNKSVPQGGTPVTPVSSLRPVMEYYKLDPGFSEAALCEKLANLYVQMQNAWTAKDISTLRPYFTDSFYTQMDRQLDQKRNARQTNYVERIAVLSVTLSGFKQVNNEDHMVALLKSRIVDYTLDDTTGKLISGSKTAEKFMTYEIDLCRTTGTLTSQATGTSKIACPSCGAPLDINVSARCEYCGSVVNIDKHDWAINSIKGISQVTN